MRVIIIFYTKFNRISSKMPSFNIGKRFTLYYFLRFFVTLEEFAGFLYIKAVWGTEEKAGYELETVLNSTFCYKLHPLELCSLATNGTQERTPDTRPAAIL